MRTIVIGVGNALRGDDGFGPAVIDYLAQAGLRDVELAVTEPARLIDHLQSSDWAVIVDACVGGGKPGELLETDQIPADKDGNSSHGMSISAALRLADALGQSPRDVRFVLAEGVNFSLGAPMSSDLRAAVKPAAEAVRKSLPSRARIQARGAVQGVGFRPFVYRLATDLGLCGFVENSPQGATIEIQGARRQLEVFESRLRAELPLPAHLTSLEVADVELEPAMNFQLRDSDGTGEVSAAILPDIATCPECLAEINDRGNRRFRYAFTNCTHCGPRFSIIEALPYDRAATTMDRFDMCVECRAEYEDPKDRRFHAQPIACPACGPTLALWSTAGECVAWSSEAISGAADVIRAGGIVAVKGIGGFHFMVDAENETAVARLRVRKHRYAKPLAVMVSDLPTAKTLVHISTEEAVVLQSVEAPIVLLTAKPNSLAPSIAPGLQTLGVMLAYAPVHHLLLGELSCPVVATSGNLSDEPICFDELDAVKRFADIADALLVHDRRIARPIDDSVCQVLGSRSVVLRRGRGYAPAPIGVPGIRAGWVGVGAHMKGSAAVSICDNVVVGQYVGNLDDAGARVRLADEVQDVAKLYGCEIGNVAHDLHPDYGSTRLAERLMVPASPVQHHVAHAAACVSENALTEPTLAVVWDGTGLGTDGSIWGGEFFAVTAPTVRRVNHLRIFKLSGGDAAARDGRRCAIGLLNEVYGDNWPAGAEAWAARADDESSRVKSLRQLRGGVTTTSAGRLFDGLASLIAGIHLSRFEADAATQFEALARRQAPQELADVPTGTDWTPLVAAILSSDNPMTLAYAAHAWLADSIVRVAMDVGFEAVALTGGCFQNALLVELTERKLREGGFRVYGHRVIPPNDEGIAFGQIIAAFEGWRLEPCA